VCAACNPRANALATAGEWVLCEKKRMSHVRRRRTELTYLLLRKLSTSLLLPSVNLSRAFELLKTPATAAPTASETTATRTCFRDSPFMLSFTILLMCGACTLNTVISCCDDYRYNDFRVFHLPNGNAIFHDSDRGTRNANIIRVLDAAECKQLDGTLCV
jgi:hypothetical protein